MDISMALLELIIDEVCILADIFSCLLDGFALFMAFIFGLITKPCFLIWPKY